MRYQVYWFAENESFTRKSVKERIFQTNTFLFWICRLFYVEELDLEFADIPRVNNSRLQIIANRELNGGKWKLPDVWNCLKGD